MNKLISAYQYYLLALTFWAVVFYAATPGWSGTKTLMMVFVAIFFGLAPLLRTLEFFGVIKEKSKD